MTFHIPPLRFGHPAGSTGGFVFEDGVPTIMKTALIAAAAVAATLAMAPAASAQDAADKAGAYVNLNVGLADAGPNFWAIQGRLGYRVNNWFGVEGEVATGIKGDDVQVGAVSVDTKLKHQLAAYAVGFLPVGENTDLIARIGYGTNKIKASAAGVSASGSDESVNFGVGVQHHFDGANGLRFDYTRNEFNDGGDANVWTIGYSRKF